MPTLTVADVKAILSNPEMKWKINSESPVTHTFITGYSMLAYVGTHHTPKEELHLVIHENGLGEIQTFKVEDLPGLTVELVKAVARMGWHLSEETGRLSYMITEKRKQIT